MSGIAGIRTSPVVLPTATTIDRSTADPSRVGDDELASAMRSHWSTLVRFLRSICSFGADIDDVAARTLEVAWRRRSDLASIDELVPWLLAIARNLALNEQRGMRRRARLWTRLSGLREHRSSEQGIHAQLVVGDPGPATRALAQLSRPDREVLVLNAWEGLEPAAIATVLEITADAAAQRLSRARRRLKSKLEEECV